jgi:hypothetical protein
MKVRDVIRMLEEDGWILPEREEVTDNISIR